MLKKRRRRKPKGYQWNAVKKKTKKPKQVLLKDLANNEVNDDPKLAFQSDDECKSENDLVQSSSVKRKQSTLDRYFTRKLGQSSPSLSTDNSVPNEEDAEPNCR